MEPVWTFTNQTQLNKKQFIDYIERKVFRTIRKYNMLSNPITLKKSKDLNTTVLKKILQTKFQTKHSTKPNTSSANLSQIAEDIFKNILKGKFKPTTNNQQPTTTKAPLLYVSDKEIELYAKLTNIKGTKRKQDKKIQLLFQRFLTKNQDLELNIIKAQSQIK